MDSFYISEYICKFYDLNTTYRLFAYSNMYLSIEIVINSNRSNCIYFVENFFLKIVVSALKSGEYTIKFKFMAKNPYSHLFCTLISENQGLEKLRSILSLRKISGHAELNFFSVHLNFFFSLSPDFFSDLYHKPEKIQVTN